jgi:hypothetical protein
MLDDTEQVAEDSTDSEDHGEWDSDIDEGECNKKQEESCEYRDLSCFHTHMLAEIRFPHIQNDKHKFMSNHMLISLHKQKALFIRM